MTARSDPGGGSPIASELPPPREESIDRDRLFAHMGYRERFLARQLVGDEPIFLAAPTGTKIDVGSWLLKGRVWALALADALAIVACGPCGRRVLARKIPYARLRRSQYNHVTGEVALAPEKTGLRGLKLDPVTGYQLLAQIHRQA